MAESERNVHFEFVALDFLATEINYVKLMLTGVSKLSEVFADDEEYHQMLLRRMWTTWLIKLREALEEYQENGCEIQHFPAELLETGTDFGSMDEAFSNDDFQERRKLYRVLVDLESIFWLDQLTTPDLLQDWIAEVEDKYLSTEPAGDLYRSLRRVRCEDVTAMIFDGDYSAYKQIRQVKKQILNARSLLAFVDKLVGSFSSELDAPVLVKAMKRYRHYKSFNEEADDEVPRLSSRPLGSLDKRHGPGRPRFRGLRELDGKGLVHGGENGVNSDDSTSLDNGKSGFVNLKTRKRERSAHQQKKRTRPGADTSDDDDEGDGSNIGREGRRRREARDGDADGPNLQDLKKEWRLSKGKLPLKAITGRSYEDAYSLMSAKQKLATNSDTRITEDLKEASSKLKLAIDSKGDQDPLDRALRKLPASITNEDATQKLAPRRSRRLIGVAPDVDKGDDAKADAEAPEEPKANAKEKQEENHLAVEEGNAPGVEEGADGDEKAEEKGQEIQAFSSDEETSESESEARAAERLEASKGLKRLAGRANKEHNERIKAADPRRAARTHGRGVTYTTEEDAMLVSGLRNFGWGRWAAIRNAGKFHPTRTTTSLKDRARNLKLHPSDYPEQD